MENGTLFSQAEKIEKEERAIPQQTNEKEGNSYQIKVERVTPELAREYLATSIMNRNVSKLVVSRYVEDMKKGKWSVNISEPISFDKEGHLLNGHHRMNAVIGFGYPVMMGVVRGADREDFKNIDTGKNRSLSDTFSIAGIANSALMSCVINRYIALRNGSSLKGALFQSSASRCKNYVQKDDYLNTYFANEEFFDGVLRFADCLYRNNIRLIQKSDIAAICAYLIKDKNHSREKVFGFFKQLHEGGSGMYCIKFLRKRLSDDLINSRINRMNPTYRLGLIAKAWNLYAKGKDTRTLKIGHSEIVNFI